MQGFPKNCAETAGGPWHLTAAPRTSSNGRTRRRSFRLSGACASPAAGRSSTNTVDQGWSGAKESRPELDELMTDAAKGLRDTDVVVVLRLDRFGRFPPKARAARRAGASVSERGSWPAGWSEACSFASFGTVFRLPSHTNGNTPRSCPFPNDRMETSTTWRGLETPKSGQKPCLAPL
jgi:hypothetical protein